MDDILGVNNTHNPTRNVQLESQPLLTQDNDETFIKQ